MSNIYFFIVLNILVLNFSIVLVHSHISTLPSLPTIKLYRENIDEKSRNKVIHNLKMRQTSASLIERPSITSDEPLKQQILAEKHLATYYGRIKLGPIYTTCLFDTGSSEFWTISDECNTPRCKSHTRFPHKLSGKKLSSTMNIKYLSGHVEGDIVLEDVQIGQVLIKNQPCGIARTDVKWSCILGLAYPNKLVSNKGIYTVFDNIIRQNILTNSHLSNQFSYYIDSNRGSITLGGVNCKYLDTSETECKKSFQFTPVTDKGYWTINLIDVKVEFPDGTIRENVCNGGCKAIVDTGTYLIYSPEEAHAKLFQNTGLSSCIDYNSLPTIHFYISGEGDTPIILSLSPQQYVLKFQVNNKDDCVMGLSPDKDVIWTFGQVFLRSFYTLFDRDKDRIGFAKVYHKNTKLKSLFGSNSRFRNKSMYDHFKYNIKR